VIYRHPQPDKTFETNMAEHHGQQCTVLRRLFVTTPGFNGEQDLEQGPMFKAIFPDGSIHDVFADELSDA